MKRKLHIYTAILFIGFITLSSCKTPNRVSDTLKNDVLYKTLSAKRITLPNQWKLTPAGTSLPLGDLPLNMVLSPSKKLIAVTNNGVDKHFIQLFAPLPSPQNGEASFKEVSKIDIAKAYTLERLNMAEKNRLPYFTINFHDYVFSPAYAFYMEWFTWLIDLCKERGYSFTNFENAIKEQHAD